MIKVDVNDLLKNFRLRTLVIGNSGSGKTHFASTFPKSYFLITEPGGQDTFLTKPELAKNVVGYEVVIPENAQDTKNSFLKLDNAIKEAKELAIKGEVNTLVLDNITYLGENRWTYINTFETKFGKSGALDTQSMYGELGRWFYQFMVMKIMSFPGNVVVNCHEMMENEDALEKKPDQSCPILPNILGGFRDKAEGMFSLVVYLIKQKNVTTKGYDYYARTDKGNQRNAKNRYNLPEIVKDISYNKIMEEINKSIKGGGGSTK